MNKKNVLDRIIFSSVLLFFLFLMLELASACNVRLGSYADGCWDRDYGNCCGWVFRGFLFDNNKACAINPSVCTYPYSDYTTYSSAALNKCPFSSNDGAACDVKAGWYCDKSFSGRWDASESKCVECLNGLESRVYGDSSAIYTDEGGINGNAKCESACPDVDKTCDEKSPGSFLNTCKYGKTYFADKCSASCKLEDEKVCRSPKYAPDCTASPECEGKFPGSNVAGGSCDNNCKFIPSVSVLTLPTNDCTSAGGICKSSSGACSSYCLTPSFCDIGYEECGTGCCCFCLKATTTSTTTTSTSTTIPSMTPNCQNLYARFEAAFGSYCGHPRWDPAADVDRDKNVTLKDGSLILQNKNNDAWCLEKLNQADPCIISLRIETRIDIIGSPLKKLRVDVDGSRKETDDFGILTLQLSPGIHEIKAYDLGVRKFSHFWDSDCDGKGNYLDTANNPYSFTMYDKNRIITAWYKVLTKIKDLNYDGTKITGRLLDENDNPLIERGGSHPTCSDPETGTVFIHPNRNVTLYYYDGSWKKIGSAYSSTTDGSFSLNWICPPGATKIKAEYISSEQDWFYSSGTVEEDISCGITTTTTSTTTSTSTTTTIHPCTQYQDNCEGCVNDNRCGWCRGISACYPKDICDSNCFMDQPPKCIYTVAECKPTTTTYPCADLTSCTSCVISVMGCEWCERLKRCYSSNVCDSYCSPDACIDYLPNCPEYPKTTTTSTTTTSTTLPSTTTTAITTTTSTSTTSSTTTTTSTTIITTTSTSTTSTTTTKPTTTSTSTTTSTTIPPGVENCCNDIDDDGDNKENGADTDCQRDVSLTFGTNIICWWTEWDNYNSNADYYSGWFVCPSGYVVSSIEIEQYTEDNWDWFYIYDKNDVQKYKDSGKDGKKIIDMSAYNTDKVRFRFKSDNSVNEDGVKVNSIVCSVSGVTTTSTTTTIPKTTSTTTTSTTLPSTTTTAITTTTTIPTTTISTITTSTTSTISTTTTIPPDFTATSFDCGSAIVNGYRCLLSYRNNLGEDAYILFLISEEDGDVLPCAVLMKAPQGSGTVEPVYLCPKIRGRYYINWVVYRITDIKLKDPIKWSTPAETKMVEC